MALPRRFAWRCQTHDVMRMMPIKMHVQTFMCGRMGDTMSPAGVRRSPVVSHRRCRRRGIAGRRLPKASEGLGRVFWF